MAAWLAGAHELRPCMLCLYRLRGDLLCVFRQQILGCRCPCESFESLTEEVQAWRQREVHATALPASEEVGGGRLASIVRHVPVGSFPMYGLALRRNVGRCQHVRGGWLCDPTLLDRTYDSNRFFV